MSYFIGLMSGTSLDAIDAALVHFADARCELCQHLTLPIPNDMRQQALNLLNPTDNELLRMSQLDVLFGHLFADAVTALLKASAISAAQITAIGSHGQTLRHYPDAEFPSTLQIGDPNIIAEQTGITTIADFRRRDMAAGGQGAPLAPAFHQAQLQNAKINRVVLNIGGIANITILPTDPNTAVTGFDTGPGNALMDSWVQTHLQHAHDQNGAWAASGQCHQALLERLLSDVYFTQPPPKSSGRETFNLQWLEKSLAHFPDLKADDIQATLTELTAVTIARAINAHAPNSAQILVCGGGVHNQYLMQRLATHLPQQAVESSQSAGIDPDWVEAMAFAWLAKQTLKGKTGNLPTVTGAHHAVILGAIYPA